MKGGGWKGWEQRDRDTDTDTDADSGTDEDRAGLRERLHGTKGIGPAVCLILWLSFQLNTALTCARALTATLRQLREVVAI